MAFYDLIRVYGSEESGLECFQGLGAAALYSSPLKQPQSGEGDITVTTGGGVGGVNPPEAGFSESVWGMQNATINRQTEWLKTLSGVYAEKLAALPQEPGWGAVFLDSLINWAIEALVNRLVDLIPGETPVETYLHLAVDFVMEFLQNAWAYVKKYYNEVGKILSQMCDENHALLSLEASHDNYLLRSMTINQHEQTAKNIIDLITGLENNISKIVPGTENMQGIIDAIRENNNNQEIDLGSVRLSARAQIITTT